MVNIHNLIRRRLLADVDTVCSSGGIKLKDLVETQWSKVFERLMRGRLIQGAYRYGVMHSDRRRTLSYDNVGGAIMHLKRYLDDGNLEHLVDVANLCMIEFEHPSCHPSPRFRTNHDIDHVRRIS